MIPEFLKEKLINQYGKEISAKIIEGYYKKRPVTLRVNTIKNNIQNIKNTLTNFGFIIKEVNWNKNALIIEETNVKEISKLEMYKNGEIYLQSLSSMIPVIILEPKQEENILDMAAAPGGKTTQIASYTDCKAFITACEKNKIRAERLKYNIEKQGAKRTTILLQDSRNLDDYFSFDKILLDAPCSGSGTINIENNSLKTAFTEELMERCIKTQLQLLRKAIEILKKGHEMIYSTCSVLEDENENNLSKVLRDGKVEIVPIDTKEFIGIQLLPVKIKGTMCICPDELYEGFFIAKLRKK